MEKECSHCNKLLPLEEFHNLKTGKMGKHSQCKTCRSIAIKKLKYKRVNYGEIECTLCHKTKDVLEFYRDSKLSLGIQSCCKQCQREKIYESQSKLENYIDSKLNKIGKYSKANGIKFELTKEDIMEIFKCQKGKCFYTDELLTYYSGIRLTKDRYETRYNLVISRIYPDKDFTKDNIELIGKIISNMKSSLSRDAFLQIIGCISSKNICL